MNKVAPADSEPAEVKSAVKLSTFEKMKIHKKKIAAAVALKVTIIVVVVLIIALGVGATLLAAKGSSLSKKAEPKADPRAAAALSFGKQSVIPPKQQSRRRELREINLNDLKHVLRGSRPLGFGRRLAIDASQFAKDSDYKLKKTSYYVSEESASAMNFVNMIFCDIMQLQADKFVNQPAYKAMVDESKCQSDGDRIEWTVEVKSVGNVETCQSDTALDSPKCGYVVKCWFSVGGGMKVTVYTEIWNPPTNGDVPKMKLRFKVGDGSQKGLLIKTLSGTTVDLNFATWMKHEQLNGGAETQTDQIHAVYDSTTKDGKVTSKALDQSTGSSSTFKLAFDGDFVKKSKNSGADICLDMRTPKMVGNQYQLYDKDGKTKVFQEGFPVEAKVSGEVCEAWVGFHGLHVHDSECSAGFADGKKVSKINYDASASRTPYTLKVANGKLWKFQKQTVQLGEIKGMALKAGWGSNAKVISWDGTQLVEIGKMGGSCFPINNYQPEPKNNKTSQKTCLCNDRSSGNWYEYGHEFWWKEDIVRVDPPIPFTVKSEDYPWGMQVSAGEGSTAFHGDIALDVEEVVTIYLDNAQSFTAGHTVAQGTATGTVKYDSAKRFTSFETCSDCITEDHVTPAAHNMECGSSGDKVQNSQSGQSIPDGAILTQANTGATGVAIGWGWVGHQVTFRTTSGTFNNDDVVTVSTPTEKTGHWMWNRVSGSFDPKNNAQISNEQNSMKVVVTSGSFQRASWASNTWSGTDITVNGTNFGKPHWVQIQKGDLASQPSASTTISYTSRELVMPGDNVPSLLCYDRCPKGSAIDSCTDESSCNYAKPSMLSDEEVTNDGGSGCTGTPSFSFSGISGSPAMTGTMANGVLASVELTNKGHTCSDSTTPTVTVGGLSGCTSGAPTVQVSCRQETDDSSSFGQAHAYTYDSVSGDLKDGSTSVAVAYSESSSLGHLNSGALFENSVANKNALKCEHNSNEVCYHEVRRELDTFYEWETASQHSARVSLVDDNNVAVKFDQPESVSYTHSGTESNSGVNYDGSKILLTYDGELHGFPTYCMDQSTGEAADCDPWSRQTPDFPVPEGALFTSTKDGAEYVSKAGEVEEILKLASNSTSCSTLDNSNEMPVAMVATDFTDFDIGNSPNLKDVPAVVYAGVLLADLEKRAAKEA